MLCHKTSGGYLILDMIYGLITSLENFHKYCKSSLAIGLGSRFVTQIQIKSSRKIVQF